MNKQPTTEEQRAEATKLFKATGLEDNPWNWHLWKRAFDAGVGYIKSTQPIMLCHECGDINKTPEKGDICDKCFEGYN